MIRSLNFLLISLILIFVGCSKDEPMKDKVDNTLKVSVLEGKVEKGPFIKGSTVTIRELNNDLLPTGKTFETEIINNEGKFKLESASEFISPYVQIACDGYFFNEVNGDLSESQIRLESIVDISNKRSINVNILTHLSKDRIIYLMKKGDSYKDASSRVREELLTSFSLQEYRDKEFEDLSISSGEKSSGALIMISSILLKDRTEAKLTEYIASLKENFTKEGKFPELILKSFREDSYNLYLNSISSNIIERYSDLGKEIIIPDLNYFIDWDGDGIAGNELGDPNVEKKIAFEVDTLRIGKEGGEFTVPIHSTIPLSKIIGLTSSGSAFGFIRSIKFIDITLENNNLLIKVAPADAPFLFPENITVYAFDHSLEATITIKQNGDFSDELLNPEFEKIINLAATAFDYTYTMEALYSNCYATNNNDWKSYTTQKINANNRSLNTAWSNLYTLNRYLNAMEEYEPTISTYIIPLRTFLYYHLTTLWGDVPYFTHVFQPGDNISRTSTSEIYSSLQKQLEKSITDLPLENNGTYFGVSKSVPRVLLAKILMQQKKYSEALALLEEIISSKMYKLNKDRNEALSSLSTEMIYAIDIETFATPNFADIIETNKYLPLIQYSEVILLAAECSNKVGAISNAVDYLNQIRRKDEVSSAINASFDVDLKETWKSRMKGAFSYFDFLKRNNIATIELSIQKHQELFPIPYNEIAMNPNMTQNSGY